MAQTALITGASVGIGRELAKLLAADGYNLLLTSRDVEKLNIVAAECKKAGAAEASVIPLDLAKPNACLALGEELVRRKTEVDVLINNAGFGVYGKFWGCDLQRQMDLIQVNITALTNLSWLLLPGMIARKRGKIMNVASVAAFIAGPYLATYFASKAYVLSFSLALSAECEGTGVSVTCVCPGPTATEFFQRAGMGSAVVAAAPMMSAQTVAQIGYRAMQRGKPLVVTGWSNRMLAQATRLAPRALGARIVGKRNRVRIGR